MGLFKNVLKTLIESTSNATPTNDTTVSVVEPVRGDETMLKVKTPGREWFCSVAISPNKRYRLAWSDSDGDLKNIKGGYRTSGHGRYFLLDGGSIILEGKLERPNDGLICDTGVFIITDWLFDDSTRSKFYAIAVDGKVLYEADSNSGIIKSNLSKSGNFAVYQLGNSEHPDGGALNIIDLKAETELSRFHPEFGYAKAYKFSENEEVITLEYDDSRAYRYTLTGECLDTELVESDLIKYASGYQLVDMVEEHMKSSHSTSLIEYQDLKSFIERALQGQLSDNYKARAYRYLGEIEMALGDNGQAIKLLEQALSINPNVGAKKLLAKLKS